MANKTVLSITTPFQAVKESVASFHIAAMAVLKRDPKSISGDLSQEKKLVSKAARDAMTAAIATSQKDVPNRYIFRLGLALVRVHRKQAEAHPDYLTIRTEALEHADKAAKISAKWIATLKKGSENPNFSLDEFVKQPAQKRLLSKVATVMQSATGAIAALAEAEEIKEKAAYEDARHKMQESEAIRDAILMMKNLEPIFDDRIVIDALRENQRDLVANPDLGLAAIAAAFAASMSMTNLRSLPIQKLVIASATIVNAEILLNKIISLAHRDAQKRFLAAAKMEKDHADVLNKLSLALMQNHPVESHMLYLKSQRFYRLANISTLRFSDAEDAEKQIKENYAEYIYFKSEYASTARMNPGALLFVGKVEGNLEEMRRAVRLANYALQTQESAETKGKQFKNIVIPKHPVVNIATADLDF